MSTLLERLRAALAERYAVRRELGRGGMATVFLADDQRHGRPVAIKVLRPDLASALGTERFLREIAVTARLNHPHILPLLDSGEADGLLFYVMPYVEGESLRARLRREKQLPLEEAVAVAREVADALGHAHSRGVVHRDIKPENILLADGHARVADFGIAQAIQAAEDVRLTGTGLAVGTPAYMSPEQASGVAELDGRTDLYSLGCVLFEMVAGAPPLTGPSAQATFARRWSETPPRVSRARPAVPPWLDDTVVRALAPVPADRFSTAGDFAAALGLPGGGVVAGGGLRSARSGVRKSAAWAVAAVMLVVVVVGVRELIRPDLVPNRVVVTPFENRTGDPAEGALGAWASEQLVTHLAQVDGIDVVPTAVATALWHQTPGQGQARLRKYAKRSGAAVVIAGAYGRRDSLMEFSAQVLGAPSAGAVTIPAMIAAAPTSADAVGALGERVAGAMAVLFDRRLAPLANVATPLPTLAAYREYTAGLELLAQSTWGNDFLGEAMPHFRRAAELDSVSALAAFLVAFLETDEDDRAAESILRALSARRGMLSGFERLLLDWLRAGLRADRVSAIHYGREVVAAAPLAEYVLLQGDQLLGEGLVDEFLRISNPDRWEHLSALLWLPELRAGALHYAGRYQEELREARDAVARWPGRLAPALWELRALAALGRSADVEARLGGVFALLPEPDRSRAEDLGEMALELRAHGQQVASRRVLDRIIAGDESEDTGFGRGFDTARALYWRERWEDAQRAFEVLRIRRPRDHRVIGYLGALAARRGDRQAAELARQYVRSGGIMIDNGLLEARLLALLGHEEQAVAVLQERAGIGRKLTLHRDMDLEPLRGYPAFEQLIRPHD